MRRWWLAVPVLLVALAAAQDRRAERETAVRAALDGFWTALVHGDAEALREVVDLPLTLLEPKAEERPAGRFVVGPGDWPDFRRQLPPLPLRADEAEHTVSGLRLEWLDEDTCLAVYDCRSRIRDQAADGHYLTILSWADGWKVVVSSVPR